MELIRKYPFILDRAGRHLGQRVFKNLEAEAKDGDGYRPHGGRLGER